jgi:hypothetical protein
LAVFNRLTLVGGGGKEKKTRTELRFFLTISYALNKIIFLGKFFKKKPSIEIIAKHFNLPKILCLDEFENYKKKKSKSMTKFSIFFFENYTPTYKKLYRNREK